MPYIPGDTHIKFLVAVAEQLNKLQVGEWLLDHLKDEEETRRCQGKLIALRLRSIPRTSRTGTEESRAGLHSGHHLQGQGPAAQGLQCHDEQALGREWNMFVIDNNTFELAPCEKAGSLLVGDYFAVNGRCVRPAAPLHARLPALPSHSPPPCARPAPQTSAGSQQYWPSLRPCCWRCRRHQHLHQRGPSSRRAATSRSRSSPRRLPLREASSSDCRLTMQLASAASCKAAQAAERVARA